MLDFDITISSVETFDEQDAWIVSYRTANYMEEGVVCRTWVEVLHTISNAASNSGVVDYDDTKLAHALLRGECECGCDGLCSTEEIESAEDV